MRTSTHTFFSLIYKSALSGISFLNSVLLARTLTPSDRVEFQYASSLAQTGMTYIGGYSNYYGYALPKHPAETRQIVQMGNLLMFSLGLLVWLMVCVLYFVPLPFVHLTRPWLWALLCMPLTFLFGYGTRLLNAANEISWLNRANTVQPLLFTICLGTLWFASGTRSSEQALFWAYSFWVTSFAMAVVFALATAYRTLRVRGVLQLRFHRHHWRETFRYGWWSSLAQAVNIANYRMDFWLVMGRLSPHAASIYGIAVVASEVLLNVSASIATVVYRRMTSGSPEDAIRITELSCRHTVISSTLVALAMYAVFPWLIRFAYGHAYAPSVWPFLVLLPGLICKAAGNILIQYAANSRGRPQTAIWMNGASAVINAALCIVLIPLLGMMGAAFASTISYALSLLVYLKWYGKVTGRRPLDLVRVRRRDLIPYVQLLRRMVRRLRRRG